MRFVGFTLLLVAISCSSGRPPYTLHLDSVHDPSLVITLESTNPMSADQMRKALLTEAARATIDRGHVYLRIDDLSNNSRVEIRERMTSNPVPPKQGTSGMPAEPAYQSEVTVSKRRGGSVRFTIFTERPGAGTVYDASQLLDRLQRGEIP